jgi:hypothetical protein
VSTVLTAGGARSWQVRLTAPAIADALAQPASADVSD